MRTINNFDIEENSPMVFKRCADQSYRFVLRKYSGSGSKLRCPRCGRKSFTPYIDTQTNEILDENVGICDHKNSCGYHFSPREYFARTRVNCQCGSHPHKKKEFFVRTRTGNSPVGNAGFSAKNNATNTSIKHYSTSLKHHQNTPNNQHISVQPHRQLWHSRADLQIKKDNRYALFACVAAHPRAGSAKETLCAEHKEISKRCCIGNSEQKKIRYFIIAPISRLLVSSQP